MLKTILICEYCGKETGAYEDVEGTLIVDFKEKYIKFYCSKCNKENVLDMGDIQKKLDHRTKLPSIIASKY